MIEEVNYIGRKGIIWKKYAVPGKLKIFALVLDGRLEK